MELSRLRLRVNNLDTAATFYQDILGMTVFTQRAQNEDNPSEVFTLVGYHPSPEKGTWIELRVPEQEQKSIPHRNYVHNAGDIYWKIGITLADVDTAVAHLRRKGITVSNPQQFRDIGYLCHLQDPLGFQIELLQHTFENNRKNESQSKGVNALGGAATLGQITLRVTDIDASLRFYREVLGMRLLSIQAVKPYGFTLYFLAYTEESPPHRDLEAVDNREWLWQRPYSTLELQHIESGVTNPAMALPATDESGFAGLTLTCKNLQDVHQRLKHYDYLPQAVSHPLGELIKDPQGVEILVVSENGGQFLDAACQ